ncbi:serine protease gd-like isoform X1 [Phlebotomus argentipes]|uniref:serine protease gd-like isoform X1 n=1 Tax=Phlebotomus argentipes TaxID=94469 RepID=UPI00289317E4|nr:serine protease gd-like isoform X1 [Phlebotomus argentipes]
MSYFMNIITSLIISSVLLCVSAQRLDHQACPDGVKYIYVNQKLGWVGLGWAWTTENHKLHNITMQVDFSTAELADTTFLGSLKIIRFQLIRNLETQKKWNLIYEIIFPTQDPLPEITKVLLNGDTLCSDPDKAHSASRPDLIELHVSYNDYLKEQSFTSRLIKKPEPTKAPEGPPSVVENQVASSENLGCGKVDLSNIYVPLVLEGTTIQRGTWPWLVSVYSYSKLRLGFRCGATLVSRKLVVTAAHCFFDIYKRRVKTEDVIVILGQYNLKRPHDTGSEIVYPDSVNIHPNYGKRNSIDSDIAVVVLTEAIRFTTYIRPACLWNETESKESIVGHKGFSAGWGRDENGNFFTELPKQIEIPVVSDEECLRSHEAFPKITSEVTFCAGWRNGSEGPCNGDSGGPLIFDREGRWTLRGVVSTSLSTDGSNTCNLNEYVVFTDVAKFRQWIISFSDEDYKF